MKLDEIVLNRTKMDNEFKIFEVPACSIYSPFKPPLIQSLQSKAMCFCCFATNVPLTKAKNCRHKEFILASVLIAPSLPLLICNICHHMLKKIEDFRLQIQNNFKNLMSKSEPEERCIFLKNLSMKPTITIVSVKAMNFTTRDPLSVSKDMAEIDSHDAFVDDYLGNSAICNDNEELTIKTETEENLDKVAQGNTTDNNEPNDDDPQASEEFYLELTPSNIKQESLHTPPLSKESTSLRDDGKDIEINPTTSKKLLNLTMDGTKQARKGTSKYLVNLLNSINNPLNLDYKYNKKELALKVIPKAVKEVKAEPTMYIPDVELHESYEGKIMQVRLTEAELLKEREKDKLRESFTKSKYKCDLCIDSFQYELQFNKHMKRYHTKKDYPMECIFCKRRYLSLGTLDLHLKKHLLRYFCLVCNKQSSNLFALTEHYNETHKDKEPIKIKFECKLCDYVSYYKARFNNHKHRMHKIYCCKMCSQKLNGYGSYKYHLKFVHDQDKEMKETGFYKCDECPASYTHFNSFKSHKKNFHVADGRSKQVYCQPCDKFYSNKFIYTDHLRHSAAHRHENNYLKFECDDCHEKFPVKRSLRLHIERKHLSIFNHKCNICNKLCVHDQALAKHIRTVHEKKRPPKTDVCHVCGKFYASKGVLKKHMRIHTGERPYACDLCGMSFAQSSTLYTHRKLKHKILKNNDVLKKDITASSSWGS